MSKSNKETNNINQIIMYILLYIFNHFNMYIT
jgi:hypothetical protein